MASGQHAPTYMGTNQTAPVAEVGPRGSIPEDVALFGHIGLTFDAADTVETCRQILAESGDVTACWRYGICQTLDFYNSHMRRGGIELAVQVFTREPSSTGAPEVDAAYAALAEHLAERDGWTPPTWTAGPGRVVAQPWYVAEHPNFRRLAAIQSPPAFTRHGIYITNAALNRA